MKKYIYLGLTFCLVLLNGCANLQPQPKDQSAFAQAKPSSILILPPTNDSTEVLAPYTLLSTLTRPVAEAGYYVFPVAMVDEYMKENGVYEPYEMHQIPLEKLHKAFQPDAVLYTHIESFGQKYVVFSSNTEVKAKAKLVSTDSGQTIWEGSAYAVESSGDGGGGIAGVLAAALVEQVLDSLDDRIIDVAKSASWQMIHNRNNGFIPGPYRRQHEADQAAEKTSASPDK